MVHPYKHERGLYRRKRNDPLGREKGLFCKPWWVRYRPWPNKRVEIPLHRAPELLDELGPNPRPITKKAEAIRLKNILDNKVLENREKMREAPADELRLDGATKWHLREYLPRRTTIGTIRSRKVVLQSFQRFIGKNKDISRIDQEHIEDYLQEMEDQGYRPATVLLHLRALRAFFNTLIQRKLLKWNPTALIKRSIKKRKKPVLKLAQVQALRSHIHPHYRPLLEYFLYTGVRPSEAGDLQWQHISMEDQVIHQPCRKVREPRDIHMTPPLQRLFRNLHNNQRPDDYVFTGVRGERLQYSTVRLMFHEAAQRSGVLSQMPTFSLRTFRDTYVSRIAARWPAFIVQQIMHHSSVSISEQYVGRLTDETRRAAESITWEEEDEEPGRRLDL